MHLTRELTVSQNSSVYCFSILPSRFEQLRLVVEFNIKAETVNLLIWSNDHMVAKIPILIVCLSTRQMHIHTSS